MHVWVTGASGFVARHLVPALQHDGHLVTGLGREAATPAWLSPARYLAVDLTEVGGVEQAARAGAPEAVVHLAGQSSAGASFAEPDLTFQQNMGGALGLYEGLRRAGARPRVLFVSTSEVYGPQDSSRPVGEDAPLRIASPYGGSKLAAETVARTFSEVYGFASVVIRPFSHTGPGQDDRFALSSFARQIAIAELRGEPGTLKVGNLEVVRDYLHVADVVDAYRVLLALGDPGEIFHIASGEGVRMRDLLDRLIARARVPLQVETDASRLRPQDFNFMVGDASRLRALGWQPRRSVDEALEALLDGWRSRVREG